jgi:hypothetical protein
MKKKFILVIGFVISLNFAAISQQSGGYFTEQGQRYNTNNFNQEFVYDLKVDSNNMIVGSVIQVNHDTEKKWCGHLRIETLGQDGNVIDNLITSVVNLPPQNENGSRSHTENVSWKIKDSSKVVKLKIDAIEDKVTVIRKGEVKDVK